MVDIHMLDEYDDREDDEALIVERYIDGLLNEFAASPEGDELLATADGFGYWIRVFVEYGYRYEDFTLPTMDVEDVQYTLERLLPRKITLALPEDADDAIPELTAFWSYLRSAYQLPNAKSILGYLGSVSTEAFRRMMFDTARAGMSKSLILQGAEAGYDMSDPDQISEFFHLYSSQQLAELADESDESELNYLAPSRPKPSAAEQSQQKKRRKTAKASRRKNRKSKKKKRK